MADEEKKEEKPFVDKYTLMKSDELFKIIDEWHADTEEAAKKRIEFEEKVNPALKSIDAIQDSYLVKKRGAKGEAEHERNVPRKYALNKDDLRVEATELLNHILYEGVKNEFGEEVARKYKEKPEHLIGYAATKNINFYKVLDDLMKNYRDITKAKSFQDAKESIAGIGLDNKFEEVQKAKSVLAQNFEHHDEVKKRIEDRLKPHNLALEGYISPHEMLQHYINDISGKTNKEYFKKGDYSFKPLEKEET